MKNLAHYIKDYIKECICGPIFKLVEAVLELFVPIVVAMIIDNGIGTGDRGYIIRMVLLMVGIGFVGLIVSVTAQYFSAKASVGFGAQLRSAVFSQVQTFSFAQMDEFGSATLLTRMNNDVNQVQTGLNLSLRLLLRSPFIVFGSMVMAFVINTELALIFVASIPVLGGIIFAIMMVTIPLYRKVQNSLDRLLGRTRENLAGVRVIRAFNKEEEEIRVFGEENGELAGKQRFVGRIAALMNPLTFVVVNVAIIILLQQGSVRVFSGNLSQGQIVALYNYLAQILVELVKLASLIITINKSLASAKRVSTVLAEAGEKGKVRGREPGNESGNESGNEPGNESSNGSGNKSGNNLGEPVVEFKNVCMAYGEKEESERSQQKALEKVSFFVAKGETVAVIGGTGSGKSTLVNLIPRFYDASEGEVLVGGRNVCSMGIKELRERVGVVAQKAVLFRGTLADNMRVAKRDVTTEEITEALRIAQASNVLPEGETVDSFMITAGGKNLSGGQRQRLTIARAVVKAPEILILDDSSSALDYATDAALRRDIKEWAKENNSTLIIVAQRTNAVEGADKIIVLDEGKVVGQGTHSELMAGCEVYREIYDSQNSGSDSDGSGAPTAKEEAAAQARQGVAE